MKESKFLEYKETVTNTFLKTVSAFANYGTGQILFGIRDDSSIKGIENPKQTCLDIENRINDNIEPVPEYTLSVNTKTSVITLTVFEGIYKPYMYKAKAYRRNDTATIPAERLELTRLILEGQNLSFEELTAHTQDLNFSLLKNKLTEILHLQSVTQDTLKTLELYKDDTGFNNAAELLADENNFPGIDIVRFGKNINIILDRETYEHESILKQYDQTLVIYRKYYQYEQIKGSMRISTSLIPEEAYREAIANAIVHRTWDVNANINVAMFENRIEITSPGGLPKGMSKEEYFRGGISILRNRIIGNIFFRLHLIERFGTGIRRINESYTKSMIKPVYDISEESIKITLPVIEEKNNLPNDEYKVFLAVKNGPLSSSEIAEATGFGKTKTLSILNKLTAEGYIQSVGRGKSKKYAEI